MVKYDLKDFQGFLVKRKMLPEKKIPFYCHWVGQFLAFYHGRIDPDDNIQITKFLNHLKEKNGIADWQVRQAEEAANIFINNYIGNQAKNKQVSFSGKNEVAKDVSIIIQKMRELIRIKHYSYSTERSYLEWVKRFYDYLKPIKKVAFNINKVSAEDVRDFLAYLAIKQRVSSSTQNQAFNSLIFLARNVLNIELVGLEKTVRAKRGPKIPVVLAANEVQDLFKNLAGKNLLVLELLYGTGMRIMEVARLRVKDIDFNENLIFIRSSKGDKDRVTMLPRCLRDKLAAHLEERKTLHKVDLRDGYGEVYLHGALDRKYPRAAKEWGWQYVFPAPGLSVDPRSGKVRRHHISAKAIQNAVKAAVRKAGFTKHVTVHTLRHSFATHLLMDGVNIREIQNLLGHKSVETTMIYTHVMKKMANIPESPLDNLYRFKGDNFLAKEKAVVSGRDVDSGLITIPNCN